MRTIQKYNAIQRGATEIRCNDGNTQRKEIESVSDNEMKWRAIVGGDTDASNSCIEVIENIGCHFHSHREQQTSTHPQEESSNAEATPEQKKATDGDCTTDDNSYFDFFHREIEAIEAIFAESVSVTTSFENGNENSKRRKRKGRADLQILARNDIETQQQERGPSEEEEGERDITSSEERDQEDGSINEDDEMKFCGGGEALPLDACNNCIDGMQWNLICTHCYHESFKVQAMSNEDREQNVDGALVDKNFVISPSELANNKATKLVVTKNSISSKINNGCSGGDVTGISKDIPVNQDDLQEVFQRNITSALEASRHLIVGENSTYRIENTEALISLKERMKELDSVINQILNGEPEVVNEDDGMEDEIHALHFSEEILRQEMEAIDIVMSTTASSLRSTPSGHDLDHREAEDLNQHGGSCEIPNQSIPTNCIATPDCTIEAIDCCPLTSGAATTTPEKECNRQEDCRDSNAFLSCPFAVIDESHHGCHHFGGVEEQKDGESASPDVHGTEAIFIPQNGINFSSDRKSMPSAIPPHNESESYLFDFPDTTQGKLSKNFADNGKPAKDYMSPLEYELQFTKTASLISNITISDGLLGSSSRESDDDKLAQNPADLEAVQQSKTSPTVGIGRTENTPLELLTLVSGDLVDGMTNDLAILERELREACDGSASGSSGIITLDFPFNQPITGNLMLSESTDEESPVIPSPQNPAQAVSSKQNDVDRDGSCNVEKTSFNAETKQDTPSRDPVLANCITQKARDLKTSSDKQAIPVTETAVAESSSTLENHPLVLEISEAEVHEMSPDGSKHRELQQASHEVTDDAIECQLLLNAEAKNVRI